MSKFSPSIETKTRSLEYVLQNFLSQLAAWELAKETDDVSTGKKYINENKHKASYKDVKKYIDQFGTDNLVSLITLAEEEKISDNTILDLLFQASYVEPTNGIGRENFIFLAKIPDEKQIDVHVSGTINGKKVNDVYKTLCDAIKDPDLIDDIQTYQVEGITFEHDGTVTLDIPQPLFWGAFVDQDKFKKELLKKLQMNEKELNDITNISNIS